MELNQQKQYDWVFSNDSSATVWYGVHGEEYDHFTGKIDSIITDKPDLENNQSDTAGRLEGFEAEIVHNIATLHKFSK